VDDRGRPLTFTNGANFGQTQRADDHQDPREFRLQLVYKF
jgi:hypothetical protein